MLRTTHLTPHIGTAVEAERNALLSGDLADQLRELLQARGVLVFRRLALSRDEQWRLTQQLGTPELQGGKEVMRVSLEARHHKGSEHLADYLKGSFFWHIDGSASERPNFASLLTADVLSDEGGQTQFANTYAAFEALPPDEREYYQTLRVVHSVEASQRYVRPEPTVAEVEGWRRYPAREHPLVWTHKNGRKSLVLGSTASFVQGMDPLESSMLLTRLREWATQPRFVYCHDWEVGDLVVWDNTGCMHRVAPYPPDSGRLMTRTVLEGEELLA
jgi:alpha-ketoglutarate-dependent taurine dioxygenase